MLSQPWLSPELWAGDAEVSLHTRGEEVTVQGTRAGLRALGRVITALAEAGVEGDHCHLEPRLELGEGVSLVIDLVGTSGGNEESVPPGAQPPTQGT